MNTGQLISIVLLWIFVVALYILLIYVFPSQIPIVGFLIDFIMVIVVMVVIAATVIILFWGKSSAGH